MNDQISAAVQYTPKKALEAWATEKASVLILSVDEKLVTIPESGGSGQGSSLNRYWVEIYGNGKKRSTVIDEGQPAEFADALLQITSRAGNRIWGYLCFDDGYLGNYLQVGGRCDNKHLVLMDENKRLKLYEAL